MAVRSKHTKVVTVPDGADTSVVRPSDWNADILLYAGASSLVGNPGAADAQAVEVTLLSTSLRFVSGQLGIAIAPTIYGGLTVEPSDAGAQALVNISGNGPSNYSGFILWDNAYARYWSFLHRKAGGSEGNDFIAECYDGTSYSVFFRVKMDGTFAGPRRVAMVDDPAPQTPAAGYGNWFNRILAGRSLPSMRSASGQDATMQPHIGRNPVAMWQAAGAVTTITAWGAGPLTITGTANAVPTFATSRYSRIRRVEALAASSSTSVAGWYSPSANLQWWVSGGSGDGGFYAIFRGGPASPGGSSFRFFMGLCGSASAPTDVNPSTIPQSLGLGCDAADTQLQIITGSTGTQNKVALGAGFPKPTGVRTAIYELTLYSPPGDSTVYYRVEDMIGGAITSGSIGSAQLPTVALGPRLWTSVAGVVGQAITALTMIYIETER